MNWYKNSTVYCKSGKSPLPNPHKSKMFVPFVQVEPISLLNIQLHPNFLSSYMSKSSKLKPNQLVDQETIHIQTHITLAEETIQIFSRYYHN